MAIGVVWWLWAQVIGLAAWPLAFRFFRRLPSRGYLFARPLGLLLVSYVLWLGASLGLLRNSVGGALFSLSLVALISWIYYRRHAAEDSGLLEWLRSNGRLVLAGELLFAGALALWSLVRAYSPDLTTAGGEKFMEIMYLNSIGRSEYFPPQDAWLGGYAISYYYFGYVMVGLLTRLSGFAAHLTFNVGVALLFALTCTGAFGLVYDLVKGLGRSDAPDTRRSRPIAFGFLGSILVAVLGNLEGFLEVLYSLHLLPTAFWRWLDILDINQPFDPGMAPSLLPARSGWWWWRASRVINDLDPLGESMGLQPIDEFPGFSFLLGDMHPHVLALPFVLLALAVALRALMGGKDGEETPGGWLDPLRRLSPLVPLCLGALGFLNTWDFPIHLVIFVIAYALGRWHLRRRWDGLFLRDVGITTGAVILLGFLFYLPFYVGFQSQAGGILPALYVGTRFRQYFVMFGPFLVAIAGLFALLVLRQRREALAPPGWGRSLLREWLAWTAAFLLVPLALLMLLVGGMLLTPGGREFLEGIRRVPFVYAIVGDDAWGAVVGRLLWVKLRYWVMPLVVAALAALGAALLRRSLSGLPHNGGSTAREPNPNLQFAILCAVAGLLLTLSVEFLYLVDNFQVRMNTIFKFYFQGWVLMAVASAAGIAWLTHLPRNTFAALPGPDAGPGNAADGQTLRGVIPPILARGRTAFLATFWILFAAGMVYPVLGNISRAGNFGHRPRLDGTAYLAESRPDDYAAIQWLNEHVAGTPTILEAPGSGGSSYVYEGRVSALTGLPTLLGWAGHEGQWRGDYTVQSIRDPDIQTIYNSPDPEAASALLEQYGIRYVYVGPVEWERYDPRGLAKFERFMDIAYQHGAVTIYQVRD